MGPHIRVSFGTHDEELETATYVLEGFQAIGATTVLVTHNSALVHQFRDRGSGVFLQMKFANGRPRFEVIEGIATHSHAGRVAKRIGFSKEAVEELVARKGSNPE